MSARVTKQSCWIRYTYDRTTKLSNLLVNLRVKYQNTMGPKINIYQSLNNIRLTFLTIISVIMLQRVYLTRMLSVLETQGKCHQNQIIELRFPSPIEATVSPAEQYVDFQQNKKHFCHHMLVEYKLYVAFDLFP